MKEWRKMTIENWTKCPYCDLCHKKISLDDLIGHHKLAKHLGGLSTKENNQPRHRRCERIAHEIDPGGNNYVRFRLVIEKEKRARRREKDLKRRDAEIRFRFAT